MTETNTSLFGAIKNSFRRFVEAGQIGGGGHRFTREGPQDDMAEPRTFRRRKHPRHATSNPATMKVPAYLNYSDDRVPCRLINISLGGAAVDVQLRSGTDEDVRLEIEGVPGYFDAAVAGTSLSGTHLTFHDDEDLRRRVGEFVDSTRPAA